MLCSLGLLAESVVPMTEHERAICRRRKLALQQPAENVDLIRINQWKTDFPPPKENTCSRSISEIHHYIKPGPVAPVLSHCFNIWSHRDCCGLKYFATDSMLLCYGSQANLGIAEQADCFASKILTKMYPGCALSAHAVSTWLLPGWHKVFFFIVQL